MIQNIVLQESALADLLEPFGIKLSSRQSDQILTYLEILLHWNRRINLTSIKLPEQCITYHFGESLYLGTVMNLEGRLLDVGSGAGFPGLALKVTSPALWTRLLEPDVKKYAFLKEVIRHCKFSDVEVRRERVEDYHDSDDFIASDIVTSRAVGGLDELVPTSGRCLAASGSICLWTTIAQVERVKKLAGRAFVFRTSKIPNSRRRVILIGRLVSRVAPSSEQDL